MQKNRQRRSLKLEADSHVDLYCVEVKNRCFATFAEKVRQRQFLLCPFRRVSLYSECFPSPRFPYIADAPLS